MPSDGQPPAKRKKLVSSGASVAFPNPSALLGRKVEVDWEGDGIFTGVVKAYQPKRKVTVPWKILYEDGDAEYGRFDSNLDIMYIYNGQRRVRWLDDRPVWDDLFIGGAAPDAGQAALAPPNPDNSKRSAQSPSSSPGFPSRPQSQVSTPSHSQQQGAPPSLDGHAAARSQDSAPSFTAPAAPSTAAAAPAVPLQKVQQVVQQATANLLRPKEPAVPAAQNPRLPSLQPVVKRSSQALPPNRPNSFVKVPQNNILKRKQPSVPSQPVKPPGAAVQPLSKLTAARKAEPVHPAKRPSFGNSAASSAPKQPNDSRVNGTSIPQPSSASLPSTASAPTAAATVAGAAGCPSAAAAAAAAMVVSRGAAPPCAAPVLKVTDFSQAGSKARTTAMESSTRLAKFSNSLQQLQGTTSKSTITGAAEEGLACARDMGASKVMRIILERLKSEESTAKTFAVCFVLDNMMYRYHKEPAGPDGWMSATAKDLIAKVAACFRELMNAVVRNSDACERLQKLFASWLKRGTFTSCGYQREFEIAIGKMRELQVSHRPPLKSIFVALPPLPGNTFSTTGVHYAMDDPWGSFQKPGAIPGVDILLEEPPAQWDDDWGNPKGHHMTWPQFFRLHPELVPKPPPTPEPGVPGQLTQMQQLQLEREAEAERAAGGPSTGVPTLGAAPAGWASVKVEEDVKEEGEVGSIEAVYEEDTWDYPTETSPAVFAPPAPSRRNSNLRSERSQPGSDQDEYDTSPNGDLTFLPTGGTSVCSPMSLQASQQDAAGAPTSSVSVFSYAPPDRDPLSPTAWMAGTVALPSTAAAPTPSAAAIAAATAPPQLAPAATSAPSSADTPQAAAAWAPYPLFDVKQLPLLLDSISQSMAQQQQQRQQAATHQLPADSWRPPEQQRPATTLSHHQEQQQQPPASHQQLATAPPWHPAAPQSAVSSWQPAAPQLPSTTLAPEHVLFLHQQCAKLHPLTSSQAQAPPLPDDAPHPSAQHHCLPPLPSSPPPLPSSPAPPPDHEFVPPLPKEAPPHDPPLPPTDHPQPPPFPPPAESSPAPPEDTPSPLNAHQQQLPHITMHATSLSMYGQPRQHTWPQ